MIPEDRQDEDIRAALHDAVADVRPREALSTIRARADLTDRAEEVQESQHRAGWLGVTVAAAAATALVIGGVAWINRTQGAPDGGPGPASQVEKVTVSTYFLGETAAGPRLFHENDRVSAGTGSGVDAAVNRALGTPRDPDYYTEFPPTTRATVTSHGDFASVDLTGPDLTAGTSRGALAATMSIQALVWTVDEALMRPVPVKFSIDGDPATTLLGVRLDGAVRKRSADSVLSPVSLQLSEGETVDRGSRVLGQAAAYEGNVVWQLRQGEEVVKEGHTTTGQCCTLSPFAFRLDAPPGHYTLVVHDSTGSGSEGIGLTSDTKDITVR